jgi:hypothetical protein
MVKELDNYYNTITTALLLIKNILSFTLEGFIDNKVVLTV